MNSLSFISYIAFIIIFIVYNAVVGLVEVRYLLMSLEARCDGDPGILVCILIWSITHFAVCILKVYELNCYLRLSPLPYNVNRKLISLNERFTLVFLGLGIWTCISLFNTKSECVDVFSNKYSALWNLIYLEVIVCFATFAVAFAITIFGYEYRARK